MSRILAFDIGIKNLAWCCADRTSTQTTVRGWANENIISGDTAEGDVASNKCQSCASKAGYWHATTAKGYCVRHCPPLTPALRDLSGNLLKKVPKMDVLKELARRADADKKALKSKAAVTEFLESRYCFPKPPVVVKKMELEDLHDGIRSVVLRNLELFSSCKEILLENQPVLKNPVMKSVQMMLFATIRDLCSPRPKVRLVHAGRKTSGATKGDEGYAERKGASEARVMAGIGAGTVRIDCPDGRGVGWFGEQKKKSDLADCLCMVMDCTAASAASTVSAKAADSIKA
jgi:hypothetical protein